MVLQQSGSIKFSQIQNEFGGTNPIKLSEYYSNSNYTAYVPGIPTYPNGIRLSNFYGKIKEQDYIYVTPGTHTFTVPPGYNNMSVLLIGPGGGGSVGDSSSGGGGGGGGGLVYANNISISPGQIFTVEIPSGNFQYV